jgi:ketosteroid isomerase-like protein
LVDELLVRELLRKWVETTNNQDADSLGELLTDDYIWHQPGKNIVGIKDTKEVWKCVFEGSRLTIMVEDSIVSGDKTATRWTAESMDNHTGVVKRFADITIDRIEDGKFAETWEVGSDKPWV